MNKVIVLFMGLYLYGCAPVYYQGTNRIGAKFSQEVVFINSNLPETGWIYRLFVPDPWGPATVVQLGPGQESVPIRTYLGRVKISFEVYKGGRFNREDRLDVLISIPEPGKREFFIDLKERR